MIVTPKPVTEVVSEPVSEPVTEPVYELTKTIQSATMHLNKITLYRNIINIFYYKYNKKYESDTFYDFYTKIIGSHDSFILLILFSVRQFAHFCQIFLGCPTI